MVDLRLTLFLSCVPEMFPGVSYKLNKVIFWVIYSMYSHAHHEILFYVEKCLNVKSDLWSTADWRLDRWQM